MTEIFTDEQSPRVCLRAIRFGIGQKPAHTAQNSLSEVYKQDSLYGSCYEELAAPEADNLQEDPLLSCEVPAGFVMVLYPHSSHLHLPTTDTQCCNNGSQQSRVPAVALPFHGKVFISQRVTGSQAAHTPQISPQNPPQRLPGGDTTAPSPPAGLLRPHRLPSPRPLRGQTPHTAVPRPFLGRRQSPEAGISLRGCSSLPSSPQDGVRALPGDPPAPPPFRGQDPCGDGGSPHSPP